MTELEIMQRAAMYIRKLSNGIDPITGRRVGENDIVMNERISRCLTYVAGLLDGMCNDSQSESEQPRADFMFKISAEQLAAYELSEKPLRLYVFTERINSLLDLNISRKLRPQSIIKWLSDNKFIVSLTASGNVNKVFPNEKGSDAGLTIETMLNKICKHTYIVFDAAAQKLIIDNMNSISEIENLDEHVNEEIDNQGKIWSTHDEMRLVELYKSGFSSGELAYELKRSESGINSKLELYGLI